MDSMPKMRQLPGSEKSFDGPGKRRRKARRPQHLQARLMHREHMLQGLAGISAGPLAGLLQGTAQSAAGRGAARQTRKRRLAQGPQALEAQGLGRTHDGGVAGPGPRADLRRRLQQDRSLPFQEEARDALSPPATNS